MAAANYWTAEMVRALPDDGKRYEVVYGELLVTPAPRMLHQLVVNRLTFALSAYLQSHPVGLAFGVPGDITWGREDVLGHQRGHHAYGMQEPDRVPGRCTELEDIRAIPPIQRQR